MVGRAEMHWPVIDGLFESMHLGTVPARPGGRALLAFVHPTGCEKTMNALPQILFVGRDRSLLQAHRLILGTYFDVEAAGRVSEACGLISRQDFDVIVMCDTLSEQECRQIADLVRDQSPQSTLLS